MIDTQRIDDRSVAVIGFGEAGRILAAGLRPPGASTSARTTSSSTTRHGEEPCSRRPSSGT